MKSKKQIKYIFSTIFGLIFGLSAGFFIGYFMKNKSVDFEGNFLYEIFKTYIILIIAYIINIIIHEGGHLIFGLITGYKFVSFRVFNIMLVKINGKYRIKKYSIKGTVGQCIMAPPDYSTKLPYVLYNLGGIIAGGFFFVICLYVSFYVQGTLHVFFLTLSVLALLLAVMNGIPLTAEVQNDAKNIMDLSKSEDNRRSFYLQLKIVEGLVNGATMKDLPEEWFNLSMDYKNNVFGMANEILKYARIFEQGDFNKAEERNDHLRSIKTIPIYKNLLLVDKIFMMILRNEDIENIKRLINREFLRFIKAMNYEVSVIRTEYVIEKYINKNNKKAAKVMKRFNNLEKHCHTMGEYRLEKSLIELLDANCGA